MLQFIVFYIILHYGTDENASEMKSQDHNGECEKWIVTNFKFKAKGAHTHRHMKIQHPLSHTTTSEH